MKAAITDRPILFSAPMIRALLAGTKTQTRRAIKPQPDDNFYPVDVGLYHPLRIGRDGEERPMSERFGAYDDQDDYPCPYGKPGDTLWVRETWGLMGLGGVAARPTPLFKPGLVFAADSTERPLRWRPSIHMPRWASRISLRVTSVRVERVQDISEEDAIAEGVEGYDPEACWNAGTRSARMVFRDLWVSINGAESWEANPWVWVVGFERVTP